MNEKFLPAWRDVITPHPDVAQGRYLQAEWAVDLANAISGKSKNIEYTDATEFFARTYLTNGLKNLLASVLQRLSNGVGEPVIQLETSFGGGKTHSLLALYHLFGGKISEDEANVKKILETAKVANLPKVNTAVIVGTKENPLKSTLWGEIAKQLSDATGKPELYEMIRDNDEQKISPGYDLLEEIFNAASPCLILIDELVAYSRKLRTGEISDGGTFENLMSFIQELTEAASHTQTALVVTIPESVIEFGGEFGKEVRDTVKNIIGRKEFVWRSVSSDEGYEIVRRRLFRDCRDEDERKKVCAAFFNMYVNNPNDFPADTRTSDYKNKLLSCYPIHPKIFEFLDGKWTSLKKFQKTRGVLRLMAKVIYNLCKDGDRSAMIMPCNLPLDADEVNAELTKNLLEDNWDSIFNNEVDGESSMPRKIEKQVDRFDRLSAARKITRSIFMGTAPEQKKSGLRGVTENEIRLCTIQPTEIDNIAVYNDALAKLRTNLYFLHSEGDRFWFGLSPTLRKLVDDKRAGFSDEEIFSEIETRLAEWRNKDRGHFKAVHICPKNSADVPDEQTARLVILSPKNSFDAVTVARNFLDNRGTVTRRWQNMLVFLAADTKKLDELKDAVRNLKAWLKVKAETRDWNLTASQGDEVTENIKSSKENFAEKLSQAYCRLIYPVSDDSKTLNLPLRVEKFDCTNEENISEASAELADEEKLLNSLGNGALKRLLDDFIWQDGNKVNVKKLWEYFAKFCYMPRLVDETVLFGAICNGVKEKTFGLSPDEEISDVEFDAIISRQISPTSFLIKAEVAQAFVDAKKPVPEEISEHGTDEIELEPPITRDEMPPLPKPDPLPKNFSMEAKLDNIRYGRQMKNLVDDVAGLLMSEYPNAQTSIRVTIKVSVPDGVSKDMQDIIKDNCSKFGVTDFRFER